MTTPTAEALWCVGRVSTSQSWAMRCIHVPMFETSAPEAHRRQLRFLSERKVPGILKIDPARCRR